MCNAYTSKGIEGDHFSIFGNNERMQTKRKKKKALFETGDLAEKMLFALINMKRFPSSSLVSEQFLCFKNFVNLFPGIMAKNVSHWFGMLLLSVCEVGSPFYLKCFSVGVHCLLEVTKAFLDNRKVMAYVKLFYLPLFPSISNQCQVVNRLPLILIPAILRTRKW